MLYILWFLIYFMATSYFNRNVEQLCCLRRFAYCFPLDCVRILYFRKSIRKSSSNDINYLKLKSISSIV